jgi:hypothetical protein
LIKLIEKVKRINSMADEQSYEIMFLLRGISSDDKSEIEKMMCRIDDQARSIMMFKKMINILS